MRSTSKIPSINSTTISQTFLVEKCHVALQHHIICPRKGSNLLLRGKFLQCRSKRPFFIILEEKKVQFLEDAKKFLRHKSFSAANATLHIPYMTMSSRLLEGGVEVSAVAVNRGYTENAQTTSLEASALQIVCVFH